MKKPILDQWWWGHDNVAIGRSRYLAPNTDPIRERAEAMIRKTGKPHVASLGREWWCFLGWQVIGVGSSFEGFPAHLERCVAGDHPPTGIVWEQPALH